MYIFIVLPILIIFRDSYSTIIDLKVVFIAALIGAFSYLSWYMGLNLAGVARAMTLNATNAMWGVILSVIFFNTPVSLYLVFGIIIIFSGTILLFSNPFTHLKVSG